MKVGIQVRSDHTAKFGGDVALARAFDRRLRSFGFKTCLVTSNEELVEFRPSIALGFNIDQSSELIEFAQAAKRIGARVAVYTLHHPPDGLRAYLLSELHGWRRLVARAVRGNPSAYLHSTAVARAVRRGDLVGLRFALGGPGGARRMLARLIDELLVTGPSEDDAVRAGFPELVQVPITHVPHPIDLADVAEGPDSYSSEYTRHYFIAGRIESRKNQLSVFAAAKQMRYAQFIFAGKFNETDPAYCRRFESELLGSPNCMWVGQLSMADLLKHIARAHAVVSPSWFEVMSLINLYAYALGTQVVSSCHTYDGDLIRQRVVRFDPSDPTGLTSALGRLESTLTNISSGEQLERAEHASAVTTASWAGFDSFCERLLRGAQ